MATFDKDTGGNTLVQNFGTNPAVNYNFMLRVEGIFDLPCKTVHVFQRENEYEMIQEGGLNDYVHMRRKPISKPFTFKVERYVGVDMLDPLANGTDLVLPVLLIVNRGRVYRDDTFVRMYTFTGCTVMGKEYGELNAEKSGLLVETTTIAYREMMLVDNIAASYQSGDIISQRRSGDPKKDDLNKEALKHMWMFADGDTAKKYGMKEQADEAHKKLVEEAAKNNEEAPKPAPSFMGYNGVTQKSKYRTNEVRKADMPVRKWPETKSTDDPNKKVPTLDELNEKAFDNMWVFANGDTAKKYKIAEKVAEKQKKLAEEAIKNNQDPPAVRPEFQGYNGVTQNSQYRKNEVRKDDMPVRMWPEKKSAEDPENSKAVQTPPRTWPETKSAEDPKNSKAAPAPPRIWPETKSAKDPQDQVPTMQELNEQALDNMWMFRDGDTAKKSGMAQRAADKEKRLVEEAIKNNQEPPASRLDFQGYNGVTQSSPYRRNEVHKADMPLRKWPETRSAVDVAQFLANRNR